MNFLLSILPIFVLNFRYCVLLQSHVLLIRIIEIFPSLYFSHCLIFLLTLLVNLFAFLKGVTENQKFLNGIKSFGLYSLEGFLLKWETVKSVGKMHSASRQKDFFQRVRLRPEYRG